MKQQPDELFREKLEQHSMLAPETSWARIESNLARKHRYTRWMRIAATVSLLAIAFVWLMPIGSEQENDLANTAPPKIAPAIKKEIASADKTVDSSPLQRNETHITSKRNPVKIFKTQENKNDAAIDFSKQETIVAPLSTEKVIHPINEETIALVNKPEENLSITEEDISTTVVYAVAEVNAKYLLKVNPTDATTSDEKASSFRKLVNKAADLKTNQNAFGGLRQKKNEILALNRNEKSEQNN